MFLRFPVRFCAYIYASMHMQACARAEKACKDTTNFSYGKIFSKEKSKKMHFAWFIWHFDRLSSLGSGNFA